MKKPARDGIGHVEVNIGIAGAWVVIVGINAGTRICLKWPSTDNRLNTGDKCWLVEAWVSYWTPKASSSEPRDNLN